jgi:putative ABC transport system permease protein
MTFWIRLAWRELINNRRFSLFFIVNLAIGLVGFIALNSFNRSLHDHFQGNLRSILTADFVVSSSRAVTTEEETLLAEVLGADRSESLQVRFLSMVATDRHSKLAELIAIDGAYPLYGELRLLKRQTISAEAVRIGLVENTGVWLSEDAAASLGVEIGDTLKIGHQVFQVDDLVTRDPGSAVTGLELAPRLYLALEQLPETGLIGFGSRVQYMRYYRFPPDTDIDAITHRLKLALVEAGGDPPELTVYDSRRIGRNLGRLVNHFTGYVGLIGIVALFLAGIGAAYLFRGHLSRNLRPIAILMSLGARRFEAYALFLLQVMILGVTAAVVAVLLSMLVLPIFPLLLQGILPPDLTTETDLSSLLIALLLGLVGSVIFCLPIIGRIHQLKPLVLLQGNTDDRTPAGGRQRSVLFFMPAVLLFWGLSIYQTGSLERASVFLGGGALVMIILAVVGWLIFRGCRRLSRTRRPVLKIAFRNLYRNQFSSLSCFMTIAMGTFLINLVPQLKNGMQEEIRRPEGVSVPGFFLLDIQPEQLPQLRKFAEDRNQTLEHISPMISGRILSVNGGSFNRWVLERRQRDGDDRSEYRRREYNLSYRSTLDETEALVAGRPFTSDTFDFSGGTPAQISLEENFAHRFGLAVGDVLEFDIQGIPISGRVINLREVRWNSFQPNFYIVFQPGVLEAAPQTFLASIPQLGDLEKRELQNAMVAAFPNISMINVGQTIDQFLAIADRLSFAVSFMAVLSVLTGLVVLYSIARYEARRRQWEINLLKVLGAGFADIRSIIQLEFGFIGFTAALLAITLSLLASYGVSILYFDRLWEFSWGYGVLILTAVSLVSVVTAMAASHRTVRQKPMALLQAV